MSTPSKAFFIGLLGESGAVVYDATARTREECDSLVAEMNSASSPNVFFTMGSLQSFAPAGPESTLLLSRNQAMELLIIERQLDFDGHDIMDNSGNVVASSSRTFLTLKGLVLSDREPQ